MRTRSRTKTTSQIFAPGGEPLVFFIYPHTEKKEALKKLIEKHGGRVERKKTTSSIVLADRDSMPHNATYSIFSVNFIHDSIKNGFLKDLNQYRLTKSVDDRETLSLPITKSTRQFEFQHFSLTQPTRRRYTKEEDKVLIEWVKNHPKWNPIDLNLWRTAEKEKILNRSASGMRIRYLHLQSQANHYRDTSQEQQETDSEDEDELSESDTDFVDDMNSYKESQNEKDEDSDEKSDDEDNERNTNDERTLSQPQTQELVSTQQHVPNERSQQNSRNSKENESTHLLVSTQPSEDDTDSIQQEVVNSTPTSSQQNQRQPQSETEPQEKRGTKRKSFADLIREQESTKRHKTKHATYEPKTRREQLVQELVKRLIDETGYPGKVVLYALIGYSGNYLSAREFLLNKGDLSKCETKPWTKEEDDAILQKKDTLRIVEQRGSDATAERAEFLQSIADETYSF